jgi:hypothetical protein
MATRGTPLPANLLTRIRHARQHLSIRETARVWQVSRNTVRKYTRPAAPVPRAA